jgi:hypothetical protein
MMSPIEVIKDKLRKYPHVRYEVTEHSVTVFPTSENGFEVSMYVGERPSQERFSVFYNGWHEEFSDEEEALECFAFGLSSDCRLKECRRGSKAYKWTVEFRRDGVWNDGGTTGLIFVQFWKRKHERYLQNNLFM